MTADVLSGKLPFHDVLGCYPGMVSAGKPQGIMALHPAESYKDILQSVIQGMTDMQNSCNIGGRNNN